MHYHFGYPFNPERSTLLPGVPTNLTVIKNPGRPDTQVEVSWDAPLDGDTPAVTYEVSFQTYIYDTNGSTFAVYNVPPNEAIDYKVRSVDANENRSAWSDVVTYTNVVPQTGVDTTTGQVDIAFTDATNTVYWDGTQYVQEVVVDTPIDPPAHDYLQDAVEDNATTGDGTITLNGVGYVSSVGVLGDSVIKPRLQFYPDVLSDGVTYELDLTFTINSGTVEISFYDGSGYIDSQLSISNGENYVRQFTYDIASPSCFLGHDGQNNLYDVSVVGTLTEVV